MFLVKWQDLTEKVVYRKFTEMYEFHVSKGLVWAAWSVGRNPGQPLLGSKPQRFLGGIAKSILHIVRGAVDPNGSSEIQSSS